MLKVLFIYFCYDQLYVMRLPRMKSIFYIQVQRNRVRSAGGIMNSGSRNDSKMQLYGTTSNDDEQQQIQVAFSQQLICNPKVLIIQGRNISIRSIIIY